MQTNIDLSTALGKLGAELREGIPQSVERHLIQTREEVPEAFVRDDDPDFVELYHRSYYQQLRFIYSALESGRDLAGREPPELAAETARQAARLGIKLDALLGSYRVCHRLIFEDAMKKADERIADQELLVVALRTTSRWLFTYFDWMTVRMSKSYERERELCFRSRDRRRRQLVRDLLDGEPANVGLLDYELDRDHLAVVAWGHEPDDAVSALADVTDLTLLTVAGTDTTAWAWLGGPEIGDKELRAIRTFQPPKGARLGLGEPGRGIDGFRLTHRQAMSAYRIARDAPAPVTWYAEVALLGLAFQDPSLAREFVLRELGPLAETDERNDLLRATLSAYFQSGSNAASAAAALDVHDRTVLYRLRSIEKRLGYPITARRDELGVALRLAPMVLG